MASGLIVVTHKPKSTVLIDHSTIGNITITFLSLACSIYNNGVCYINMATHYCTSTNADVY